MGRFKDLIRQCFGVIAPSLLSLSALAGCSAQPLTLREPLVLSQIPIQYNFGGVHTTICLDEPQWGQICELFQPSPTTPQLERHAIRMAVLRFNQIAGSQTPIHRDLARNQANPLGDGCMDCRDISANTTTCLALLQQHDLLRWHEVMRRTFRGPLHLDSHWSAMIRDCTDGALYVVDGWDLDFGHPPHVQMREDWLRKRPPPDATP